METKKKKLGKRILLVILVIIAILLIVFISYKASIYIDINRRFKEFEKRQAVETKGTLSYIDDENYAKVENMDYITQDGIGVKIDSISVNDDLFTANVSFKLNKDFDYRNLGFSFAIYDEDKNIYEIYSRMHMGEKTMYDYNSIFMQKELGIYNKKDVYSIYLASSAAIEQVSIDNNEKVVVSKIKLMSKDKFPESKKLYIKIFDLGYFNIYDNETPKVTAENVNLTDAKWQFEFDVPEEMNNREILNLKLAEDIPGLEITKMTLSETRLAINFNSKDYMDLIAKGKDMPGEEFRNKVEEMLNITDGEGNKYQETSEGTTGEEGYRISFDVTKEDLSKKLYINFKVGDTQYKSELLVE